MRFPDPSRVGAVLVTDLRARLRRPSAALLMGGAALAAVLVIPVPGPGRGLVQIGTTRALHTSGTLALATAVLLSLAVTFFGFYVVSDALGRDARTRVATLVASTPVSNAEYLAAKLLGSVALLSAVGAGFFAASIVMQLVRGEGPLEPATYLAHHLLLVGPCLVWVAVLALVFECTPGLSGRLGELAYLVVWGLSLVPALGAWKPGGSLAGRVFDVMGFGLMVSEVESIAGTQNFSIGFAPGDVSGPPLFFPGLSFPPAVVATRAATVAAALLLFPLALVLFRRFDPARTRRLASRRALLPALLPKLAGALTRPLVAPLLRVAPDVALTFRLRPLLAPAIAVSAVLGLTLPAESVRTGLLPVVFALLSLALADVATRERAGGLSAVVFAAPRRRERFAAWKLGSAAGAALLLGGVPALRLLVAEPRAGLSALVGLLLLAGLAVALGIATGTPKPFVAVSLALWYVALSARGQEPVLDYGGWFAAATPTVQAGWALVTALAAAVALLAQRWRLARER